MSRLQQAVFAAYGLVSAVAMPPLVPVRFINPAGALRVPDPPGTEVPRGWRGSTTALVSTAGCLLLGLDSGGAWQGLRADSRYESGDSLFAEGEGFFLGCPSDELGIADLPPDRMPGPTPAFSFSSADLAVFMIEVPEAGPWWTRISWEIEDRRPLRGRKGPPPARAGRPPRGE